MKKILLLIILFSFNFTFACSCLFTTLSNAYHRADFVAEITVLNVYGNNATKNTYKADIKFERFFKGKSEIKTLDVAGNIGNFSSTSCQLSLRANAKYLIFLNNNNKIVTSCTPHYILDDNSYQSKISAVENLFSFLEKNTTKNDEFIFYFEKNKKGKSSISKLKNFKPKNNFAVYEITSNSKNVIGAVKNISEFGDRDNEIAKLIKKNLNRDLTEYLGKRILIAFVYIPEYIPIKYRDHVTSELY
ncbi:hypothetical protein [Chryseobacterium sp. RLHN22]|uniref:hypothetical protein n=1 Tax=Chryseobacterium sp. RLHN22 TaxID=3437885 RepID=UPI003D9AFF71